MHNGKPYGYKADSWSFGVVTYAVLAGKLPFNGKDVEDVIEATCTTDLEIPQNFSKEARALVIGLLQKEPSDRTAVKGRSILF